MKKKELKLNIIFLAILIINHYQPFLLNLIIFINNIFFYISLFMPCSSFSKKKAKEERRDSSHDQHLLALIFFLSHCSHSQYHQIEISLYMWINFHKSISICCFLQPYHERSMGFFLCCNDRPVLLFWYVRIIMYVCWVNLLRQEASDLRNWTIP